MQRQRKTNDGSLHMQSMVAVYRMGVSAVKRVPRTSDWLVFGSWSRYVALSPLDELARCYVAGFSFRDRRSVRSLSLISNGKQRGPDDGDQLCVWQCTGSLGEKSAQLKLPRTFVAPFLGLLREKSNAVSRHRCCLEARRNSAIASRLLGFRTDIK